MPTEEEQQSIDPKVLNPELRDISDYLEGDVAVMSDIGFSNYCVTRDGMIWNISWRKWMHPFLSGGFYNTTYALTDDSGVRRQVNVQVLVGRYFLIDELLDLGFVPCADGTFLVNEFGSVYDMNLGRFRVPSSGGRYLHMPLHGKYYNLHRLVAENFVPNTLDIPVDRLVVNHIDGDRHNNMASNLEWCTQQQNVLHSYATGGFDNFYNYLEQKNGVKYCRPEHKSGSVFDVVDLSGREIKLGVPRKKRE